MVSLRQQRSERLMSIRELAKAADVSPATIVNIEAGRHDPFPATMRRIAAALGVEAVEIDEFAEMIRKRSEAPAPPDRSHP
jgi:transcriptional regulator with XRE-family HTH domain